MVTCSAMNLLLGCLTILTASVPLTYSAPGSLFPDRPSPRLIPSPPGFFPPGWSDLYPRGGIPNHPFPSPFHRSVSPINDTLSLIYNNFSPTFPEIFNDTSLFDDTYRKQRQAEEALLSTVVDFPFLAAEETSIKLPNAAKDAENAETAVDQIVYSDEEKEETRGQEQEENGNKKKDIENKFGNGESDENKRTDNPVEGETSKESEVEMDEGRQEEMQLQKSKDMVFSKSAKPEDSSLDAEGTEKSPEQGDREQLTTTEELIEQSQEEEVGKEDEIINRNITKENSQSIGMSFEMHDKEEQTDYQSESSEATKEEENSEIPDEKITIDNQRQDGAGVTAEVDKETPSPKMPNEEMKMDTQSQNGSVVTEVNMELYSVSTFEMTEKGKDFAMDDEEAITKTQNQNVDVTLGMKEMEPGTQTQDANERTKLEDVTTSISETEEEYKEISHGRDETKSNEIASQEDFEANIISDNKEIIPNKTKTQILPESNPGELLNSDLDVVQDNNATSFFCSPDGSGCLSKSKSILMTTGILIGIIVGLVTVVGLTTGLSVYTFHHWKLRSKGARRSRSANNVENGFTPVPRTIERPLYAQNETSSHGSDSPLNTLEAITVENYRERAI